MYRRRLSSTFLLPLTVLSAFLAFVWTSVEGGHSEEASPAESLARIYVFYSEPPFKYEPGDEIRIRLVSLWDRDMKEREIREQVARKGADVVILERSFMELDENLRVVGVPGPRGVRPWTKLPTQTAYVAGRVATRIQESPTRRCERLYPVGFDTAWTAVHRAIRDFGWQLESADTDSRYLTTKPVVTAAVAMECDPPESDWQPAVFMVFVNSYFEESFVRFDVTFVDRTTGGPSACRSVGVYENAFFRKLDSYLGGNAE